MRTIARWRWGATAGMLALAAAAVTLRAQEAPGTIVAQVISPYQEITVLDTPDGFRNLVFDAQVGGWSMIQSQMNKSHPLELTMSYSRHMVASLALVDKPRRILIVGLGGGCLQRYLHEVLPDTRIDTAELDPQVLAVAQKYFNFQQDARQVVAIGDGRRFIEQSRDKYDAILLDAASATSIPYLLSTKEFLQTVRARLADGGLVAANVWTLQGDYANMLKTYDAVFPEWHIVHCAPQSDVILTAFPVQKNLTLDQWKTAAAAFEKTYHTDLQLPHLLADGFAQNPPLPPGAQVLLDKDAPKPPTQNAIAHLNPNPNPNPNPDPDPDPKH